MADIKIYTTTYCPYCKKAKELFSNLDVEFQEIDVTENAEERERVSKKYNYLTVPMIVINDQFIGGYDDLAKLHAEGKLKEML